jgi:hypothetical protein
MASLEDLRAMLAREATQGADSEVSADNSQTAISRIPAGTFGGFNEIVLAIAEVLASGVAGNAAYDTIKWTFERILNRHASVAVERAEAIDIALSAAALQFGNDENVPVIRVDESDDQFWRIHVRGRIPVVVVIPRMNLDERTVIRILPDLEF